MQQIITDKIYWYVHEKYNNLYNIDYSVKSSLLLICKLEDCMKKDFWNDTHKNIHLTHH